MKNLLKELRKQDFIKVIPTNVFLVGGLVRDHFNSKHNGIKSSPKDIDLVVEGLSQDELLSLLKPFGKANLVGKSFGVIKFIPDTMDLDEPIDIALARKEVKTGHGHKGFDILLDKSFTILDDLERRDFTMNAIAVNVKNGEIVDPFKGIDDIKNKRIKSINELSFVDDPLRILRGVQFASRMRFGIESTTIHDILKNVNLLSPNSKDRVSGERMLEEIKKVWFKKGDLFIFFNIFEIIGKSIFNTINSGKKLKDSKTFIDFLFNIKNQFNISLDDFIKILKLDNKTKRSLQAIDIALSDLDIIDKVLNIHKLDDNVFDSVFVANNIKKLHNKAVRNNIPLDLKMLKIKTGIDGNSLNGIDKNKRGKVLNDILRNGLK